MSYNVTPLWNEKETRKKYVIKAGTNKYHRQMYLNQYTDVDEWVISAVPLPLSKRKALNLIKRVKVEIIPLREKFPKKYPEDMEFELEEYTEKYNYSVGVDE